MIFICVGPDLPKPLGKKHDDITKIKGNVIVVAHDLSPADTIQMNLKQLAGFITDIGGKVSHTAILSRSLGIPAVVGLEVATSLINGGDLLIIDGDTGEVVINPTEEVSRAFLERKRRIKSMEREVLKYASLPAETRDGVRIRLAGQYRDGRRDSLPRRSTGQRGWGFIERKFSISIGRTSPMKKSIFRPIGGWRRAFIPRLRPSVPWTSAETNSFPIIQQGNEMNPAMGLRAIRFSMKEIDIFKTQLRGILRASAYGKLRILFPMISGVEEIRQAKAILEEVKKGLTQSKDPFDQED